MFDTSHWKRKGTTKNGETHGVHLHAGSKVGQFEMALGVQQHVVWLDVAVYEAHVVDGL